VADWEAKTKGVVLDVSGTQRLNRSKNRKKVKLNDKESWKSQASEEMNSASKALYNFNFMESTLLFCLCLVVLSGLMFQSDQVKPGTRWQKGLTLWTFIVIMFSVAYFFGILFMEIAVAMGYFDQAKAKKKLGIQDDADEEAPAPADDDEEFEMATSNPIFGDKNEDAAKLKKAEDVIQKQADEIKQLKMQAGKASLDGGGGSYGLGRQHSMKKKKSNMGGKKKSGRGLLGADAGDWEEAVSKKSGKTYYYNKKTKETRWENPKNSMALGLDTRASLSKPAGFGSQSDLLGGSDFSSTNPMALARGNSPGKEEQSHAL